MDTLPGKLDQAGRVLIPSEFRKALGLEPGDELMLELHSGFLRIYDRRQAWNAAQAFVRKQVGTESSLAEELISDRRREAANE